MRLELIYQNLSVKPSSLSVMVMAPWKEMMDIETLFGRCGHEFHYILPNMQRRDTEKPLICS